MNFLLIEGRNLMAEDICVIFKTNSFYGGVSMKKTVLFFATALFILTLAGCASSSEKTTEETASFTDERIYKETMDLTSEEEGYEEKSTSDILETSPLDETVEMKTSVPANQATVSETTPNTTVEVKTSVPANQATVSETTPNTTVEVKTSVPANQSPVSETTLDETVEVKTSVPSNQSTVSETTQDTTVNLATEPKDMVEPEVILPEIPQENVVKTFTLEELKQYDGKNGQKGYIAVNGIVYDISDSPRWRNGEHNGFKAGQDLTQEINSISPHGDRVLGNLPVVGRVAS
jgi:predicted heme/steroid binding protein